MKSKFILAAAAAVFVLAPLQPAEVLAQEGREARSLSELLRLVEQGRARDSEELRAREREFAAAKAEQERLLREATQRQRAIEQSSEQLEARFEENEQEIAVLNQELNESLGVLRELFGVVQLVAGDAASQFENSLTSIQFEGRREFLLDLSERMGQSARIASVDDLERLWFELQREATELGKVVRMPLEVVDVNGNRSTRDVVRVGAFNIVSDGKYLSYEPATQAVAELVRQPEQGRFISSTAEIVNAQEGFVPFGLDVTRGQILSLLIQQPNLRERIAQGAEIGYLIIALGLLGLLLAGERLITLTILNRKVSSQLKDPEPSEGNPLGRVLKVYQDNKRVDVETLELKLSEAIMRETPKLQRFLLFIKIISVVAPLMGLLGTVTGMIQTFQAITLFGTGDPTLMAGGISQALVTTVLGLVVAIPMVLLHTIVSGRSRRIVNILQEQSAGIVAQHSESENAMLAGTARNK
ncbi:MAG TPA: MotA/TolQ/ExbB proton channel family protein [Gammaproteobacteria bacterium]|nr:MotA/TolQ/ExbB proton channel family protein [Gammaproteobacteria bacterium]